MRSSLGVSRARLFGRFQSHGKAGGSDAHLSITGCECFERLGRRTGENGGTPETLSSWGGFCHRVRSYRVCARIGRSRRAHAIRSHHPSGAGRRCLPSILAGLHNPAPRNSGVVDRHIRGDGSDGIFAQQSIAFRIGASDWHRGRRCDRCRRKCTAQYRKRPCSFRSVV